MVDHNINPLELVDFKAPDKSEALIKYEEYLDKKVYFLSFYLLSYLFPNYNGRKEPYILLLLFFCIFSL